MKKYFEIGNAEFAIDSDSSFGTYSHALCLPEERFKELTLLCKTLLFTKATPENWGGVIGATSTNGKQTVLDTFESLLKECKNEQEVIAVSFIIGMQCGKNAIRNAFIQDRDEFTSMLKMSCHRTHDNGIKLISKVACKVIDQMEKEGGAVEPSDTDLKGGVYSMNKRHPHYKRIKELQDEMVRLLEEASENKDGEEEDRTKIG